MSCNFLQDPGWVNSTCKILYQSTVGGKTEGKKGAEEATLIMTCNFVQDAVWVNNTREMLCQVTVDHPLFLCAVLI